MPKKNYLFSINGIHDGAICDEGVIYQSGTKYYVQWIGLGVTRCISKKCVDELRNSDLVIK